MFFDSLNFLETSVHKTEVVPCSQIKLLYVIVDIRERLFINSIKLNPLRQLKQSPLYKKITTGAQKGPRVLNVRLECSAIGGGVSLGVATKR